MACNHSRYHDGHHMTIRKIERLQKSRSCDIARTSPLITHCEDCGADISDANIHRVWTTEEVMAEMGQPFNVHKGKRQTHKDRVRQQKTRLEAAGQKRLL